MKSVLSVGDFCAVDYDYNKRCFVCFVSSVWYGEKFLLQLLRSGFF